MSLTASENGSEDQTIILSARATALLKREAERSDFADDDAAPALTAVLAEDNLDWEYSKEHAGRRERIRIFRRNNRNISILY